MTMRHARRTIWLAPAREQSVGAVEVVGVTHLIPPVRPAVYWHKSETGPCRTVTFFDPFLDELPTFRGVVRRAARLIGDQRFPPASLIFGPNYEVEMVYVPFAILVDPIVGDDVA